MVGSDCPKDPDETAEVLYLGRLEPIEAEAFRQHMAECMECRTKYEENVAFIEAIRKTAGNIKRAASVKTGATKK